MEPSSSTRTHPIAYLIRAITALNLGIAVLAKIAMWLLCGVVLYDVFMRSLGAPPVWGAEVSVYLMLAIAFLGLGPAAVENGHFRVTLVVDRFSPLAQRMTDLACTLAGLAFTALFTWGAWRLAAFSYQLGFTTPTVLKMPVWVIQAFIVAGGMILLLAQVQDALRLLLPAHAFDPSAADSRNGTGGQELQSFPESV